jgi:hypothetical protein
LLSKIVRLNTFSGTTLDAALVPLIPGSGYASEQKSTTSMYLDSNLGPAFAGTYSETTGITQSLGYLVTGQRISRVNMSDSTSAFSNGQNLHMSIFVMGAIPASGRIMGVFRGAVYTRHYLMSEGNGGFGWGNNQNSIPSGFASAGPGFFAASGTLNRYTRCSAAYTCTSSAFGYDSSTPSDWPVNIFAVGGSDTGVSTERYWGNGVVSSGTRVAGYSIGYALTQAEMNALGAAFWNLYGRCGRPRLSRALRCADAERHPRVQHGAHNFCASRAAAAYAKPAAKPASAAS